MTPPRLHLRWGNVSAAAARAGQEPRASRSRSDGMGGPRREQLVRSVWIDRSCACPAAFGSSTSPGRLPAPQLASPRLVVPHHAQHSQGAASPASGKSRFFGQQADRRARRPRGGAQPTATADISVRAHRGSGRPMAGRPPRPAWLAVGATVDALTSTGREEPRPPRWPSRPSCASPASDARGQSRVAASRRRWDAWLQLQARAAGHARKSAGARWPADLASPRPEREPPSSHGRPPVSAGRAAPPPPALRRAEGGPRLFGRAGARETRHRPVGTNSRRDGRLRLSLPHQPRGHARPRHRADGHTYERDMITVAARQAHAAHQRAPGVRRAIPNLTLGVIDAWNATQREEGPLTTAPPPA